VKQASFPWLMRIKGRVLIFGIAMSIFPLLFLGLANFNATRLYLQERIQLQNFERATALAEQISEFVQYKAASMSIVTYTNASTLVGQDPIAREMILATLLRQESYFEAIEVADLKFNVLGQIDRRNVILPLKADVKLNHRDLTANTSFSISPVFFSNDGRPQFYLTVGIQDPLTRKNIGYLQAKTDLKGMVTKIANLRIGQAGYIYLTDELGNLIGHTDFSNVLRQENVRQNPDVQAFLAGQRPSPQGTEYRNSDGVQVVGLFAPVENLNWGVFIEQPIREAYQHIYEFSRKLLGILLVAIALVTLISIMFGLKLTRPIENLEGEVRRIILTGDLKSEIPQQTQDEIGRLVQSFNQLLAQLNEISINLITEKELLATVVGGIGAGMVLLDSDKRIIWWNSIFAQWFAREEFLLLTCEEFIGEEGADCSFTENGSIITHDIKGKRSYLRKMYYPLHQENVTQPAYLVLLEDVTQQVEMEARVIETDKMAAVGLLASGIAHEINNPLSIVSAHSEDMLDRLKEEPAQLEQEDLVSELQIINQQISRCKQITGGLLHFARKRQDTRDLINISTSTVQTIDLLEYRAKQKRIQIAYEMDKDLYVFGNENEWQQVILNIVTNALDASEEGGKIEIRTRCIRGAIRVVIEDNGQGIPGSQLKRILEPFYTTKPSGQGTGLGLFVSYGIIQKMNGQLEVQSVEGQGTIVEITLPNGS